MTYDDPRALHLLSVDPTACLRGTAVVDLHGVRGGDTRVSKKELLMKVGRIEQLTHTLRPWSVGASTITVHDFPKRRESISIPVWGQDSSPTGVATITSGSDRPVDEAKANARLIAAAPELLAACKAFVEWYAVDSTEQKRDDAFYAAQDAIAKAEGAK